MIFFIGLVSEQDWYEEIEFSSFVNERAAEAIPLRKLNNPSVRNDPRNTFYEIDLS